MVATRARLLGLSRWHTKQFISIVPEAAQSHASAWPFVKMLASGLLGSALRSVRAAPARDVVAGPPPTTWAPLSSSHSAVERSSRSSLFWVRKRYVIGS